MNEFEIDFSQYVLFDSIFVIIFVNRMKLKRIFMNFVSYSFIL